jgi:hypothetical protein
MDADKVYLAATMVVPGLGFLALTLALPGAVLSGLAAATLAVVVTAVAGWTLTHRGTIEGWGRRTAGRWIAWTTVLGVVLLIAHTLSYLTVVASYTWPPGSEERTRVLVPATLDAGSLAFPYVDCTRSFEALCDRSAGDARAASSAQSVADQMSATGPDAFLISRGAAWNAWAALLVAAHALTGAVLVFLFGVLRVRRVDLADFFRRDGTAQPTADQAGPS